MPTYEYECEKCKRTFEEFQSITSVPLTECRYGCGGKVRRLLSGGAGLLFKGSGFYITDYRSESYKQKAKAESPTSSTAGSTAESKSGASAASEAKSSASSSK